MNILVHHAGTPLLHLDTAVRIAINNTDTKRLLISVISEVGLGKISISNAQTFIYGLVCGYAAAITDIKSQEDTDDEGTTKEI